VNRHGETGLVVEPNDHEALAHALNTLLGDPALSQRLGAGARRHVEQAFTVERMTAQSADLYRQVVLERGVNGHAVFDPASGDIPRVKV
jgi:glycosyltransferase involved in cell wall biosynthesis